MGPVFHRAGRVLSLAECYTGALRGYFLAAFKAPIVNLVPHYTALVAQYGNSFAFQQRQINIGALVAQYDTRGASAREGRAAQQNEKNLFHAATILRPYQLMP